MEHAYHPSAFAETDPRRPLESRVSTKGDLRRQLVTGPDGKQYALRWRKVSESIGKPQAGRLSRAAQLPKVGPGFRHFGGNPWGTDEAVAYIRFAAWVTSRIHPKAAPILVRDLSAADGGHLPPHKSHRTGRDADIGWYHRKNDSRRYFEDPGPRLDVGKSWTFIEALLRTGAVQYIFVDRRIQKELYDHALAGGWDQAQLDRLFQHPRGGWKSTIRHVRGHRNHMHVRFACPPEDERCEP